MDKEQEMVAKLMETKRPHIASALFNHYGDLKNIKKEMMVKCLCLLDEYEENPDDLSIKQQIRKLILDSFNDLPRKGEFLNLEIAKILKE